MSFAGIVAEPGTSIVARWVRLDIILSAFEFLTIAMVQTDGVFYCGVVKNMNADGSMEVLFDDGDVCLSKRTGDNE